jgi:hypothetical protein
VKGPPAVAEIRIAAKVGITLPFFEQIELGLLDRLC